jgi:low affinity Fe/Cu permease
LIWGFLGGSFGVLYLFLSIILLANFSILFFRFASNTIHILNFLISIFLVGCVFYLQKITEEKKRNIEEKLAQFISLKARNSAVQKKENLTEKNFNQLVYHYGKMMETVIEFKKDAGLNVDENLLQEIKVLNKNLENTL